MRYVIVKFDTEYGMPVYRVRLKRFPWSSWVKDESGAVVNFATKEEAHENMRKLAGEGSEVAARPREVPRAGSQHGVFGRS